MSPERSIGSGACCRRASSVKVWCKETGQPERNCMLKLKGDSLDWALSHALLKGDTDILPHAFEFQALKHNWDNVKKHLLEQDVLGWQSRPLRRCLSPKRRYGFRIATQIDPLDFLIFSALTYEIGEDLESHRLPWQPDGDHNVVSSRFAPNKDGELFDPGIGYKTFQQRSNEISSDNAFTHVVLTDIADFFPRLYLHRVEGALSNSTKNQNHVLALSRLFSQWNQRQSYGIPVGSAPARFIAEVSIDDIDKILRAQGITFVRYMDDYRLFADSHGQGYEHLATLADALFKNHGLTLQQEKTSILSTEAFLERSSVTEESQELDGLSDTFAEFLESAGIHDPYGNIEYADLDASDQELIDSLNLEGLLENQLARKEIDQAMVRFLLRRLGQMNSTGCVDTILKHMDQFFTVVPQVVEYLARLRGLSFEERQEIGGRVLAILDTSSVAQLDFHKTWLLSLFSEGTEWGNSDRLASLYEKAQDNFSRRKLALALGKSQQDYWFRTRKDEVFEFGGWLRRAFISGASCLPSDERKHWYDFLKPRLDVLEQSVMSWARYSSTQPPEWPSF